MKVAIDVVPIRNTGEMGGALLLVLELIKGLALFNKSDKYYLLTAEWNHQFFEQFEKFGVERICVHNTSLKVEKNGNLLLKKILKKLFKIFNIKIKKKSKSILRTNSIDILFCPMSAISLAEPGIPTLSLIYDLQHEYYPQFFSDEEIHHRKKFYNGICDLADYVVCISEFTKNTLIEKLNYPENKSKVIYISIQDRLNNIDSTEQDRILDKFNLSKKIYAYYPANFWLHKNHRMLLVAMSIFLNKHPEIDFHLCLTGSLLGQENSFNEIINQMNLQGKVHHFGYLSELEVSALMAGANFLVFPSLFEGFGIPVAEAMSNGIPVMCSNNTSLPEVGGDAAQYFDPRKPEEIAEIMYMLITDNILRQKLITKGTEQVKKFNSETMVKHYHDTLHEVAKKQSVKGNLLKGVYGDNWTEPEVLISVGEDSRNRVINIEMHLPPVSPHKQAQVYVTIDNKKKKHTLINGQVQVIKEILPSTSCDICIEIENTFRPKDIGIMDKRELGIQMIKIEIKDNITGETIRTFHKA
ncbi:glycosyltransferase [Paenibacillus sp. LMG 31456]|uniref:Glycosyltransferase n=1 Tax=Paenibacillus foliorum TaxID=2654974 RepID=A0A972JXY4_9BACL|nr:glycosyltransferase family 1 protein [Paenibacillus foliorum]NOU92964.1 glycosyltransferase [Paenibacillus foliorum]